MGTHSEITELTALASGSVRWSKYLAVEATHLVQWDVLGAPIQIYHLLIRHRLEAPGWVHRHHESEVVLSRGHSVDAGWGGGWGTAGSGRAVCTDL